MGKKLYVGNLTDSVSSTQLQEWFTPFGTVQSAQVIQDRDLGRSKGVRLRRDGHRRPGRDCDPGTQ
jgi:RNA recognition motif-containing protein